jgi:hypothetical protein
MTLLFDSVLLDQDWTAEFPNFHEKQCISASRVTLCFDHPKTIAVAAAR